MTADSGRLSVSWAARQLLGRVFLPGHALRRARLRRSHARTPTAEGNAQLLLYNRMLPGDFLHYGYFDDPSTPPEAISFDDLYQAQLRYADKIVAAVGPPAPGSRVLDVGSGMGGVLAMLKSVGHEVVGLTPDRYQVEHIRRAYPDIPVLRCRFEELANQHAGRFGTVVHAESIQYMDPAGVFDVMDSVLAPDGRWVVADYFRTPAGGDDGVQRGRSVQRGGSIQPGDSASEHSGWPLEAFRERIDRAGYCVAHEEDMTPHVLPTLSFARLLAERIGLPVYDFATEKVRAKRPGAHYVVKPVATRVRQQLVRNLNALDPESFSRRKRYLLMTLHKKERSHAS